MEAYLANSDNHLLTDDAKPSRTVNGRLHFVFRGLRSHRSAPNLSEIDEKQLLVGGIESGHVLLLQTFGRLAVIAQPFLVSTKCLLDAAVVCDILALSNRAVDGQIIDFTHSIAAVLRNETIGPFVESLDGRLAPPPIQIAVAIEESSFVIESVRQFVTDHHLSGTVFTLNLKCIQNSKDSIVTPMPPKFSERGK